MHSSQHPCALAMPFKKDPFFRGEIKFLANNGSKLNVSVQNHPILPHIKKKTNFQIEQQTKHNSKSTRIAENICHDHFNEFILIPFDYASGEN